jgi:endonuclease YncB( thermonuclease family)
MTGATSRPPAASPESAGVRDMASSAPCHVVDGDTLRCGAERIRLLGIDAPELPGHCARNRHCAPGDPYASLKSLEAGRAGRLRITRIGTDRYGRTLALVMGRHGDLSCWQLAHDAAIYKPAWDNDGRVAALCPRAIRARPLRLADGLSG